MYNSSSNAKFVLFNFNRFSTSVLAFLSSVFKDYTYNEILLVNIRSKFGLYLFYVIKSDWSFSSMKLENVYKVLMGKVLATYFLVTTSLLTNFEL